jgi:hypothetical protein
MGAAAMMIENMQLGQMIMMKKNHRKKLHE